MLEFAKSEVTEIALFSGGREQLVFGMMMKS